MTLVKVDNERARPVPAPDPTAIGTLAYDRWHKDDDAKALARYESRFITHAFLHAHEVVDDEIGQASADTRARARRALHAGHLHEPQPRTYGNEAGLSRETEGSAVVGNGRTYAA